MKGHTGKDEGRVNCNPNYSYRMVFLTNFLIFLMCTIVLAVYFDIVLSAFDEYGLSWKFMFSSLIASPPVIGTIYGLFTMRDIYMHTFGIWEQSSPCKRS